MRISGNHNSVVANHISETIDTQYIKPSDAVPVIIHVVSGKGNYISNNHIVATIAAPEVEAVETGSCFSMQVEALLTTKESETLNVINVLVEKESVQNTILDMGNDTQVVMDRAVNAFRATPEIGV